MTNEAKGMGKGLLIGVFTGAAVGSVLALLFAPKSGKRLREDIKTRSQDMIDDTQEYYSKAKKRAAQFFNGVKKKSESLISDSQEQVDAIVDDSEKIYSDAKEKIGSYIESGKVKVEKEKENLRSALKTDRHTHL